MENKTIKIFHAQKSMSHYSNWIPNREIVNKLEDADILWLEGGEDVHPKWYQQPIHPTVGFNLDRDKYEVELAREAIKLGKKIVGTCRGSQLCCVLAGGDLIQDQPNPTYYHTVKTYDGKEFAFTSTHHQAQYPFVLPEEEYKVLAYTEDMLSYHKNGWDEEVKPPKEVEICYYSEINALAIQPHPESMDVNSPGVKWLQELFNKFIINGFN